MNPMAIHDAACLHAEMVKALDAKVAAEVRLETLKQLLTPADSPALTQRAAIVATSIARQRNYPILQAPTIADLTTAYKRGALEERQRLLNHLGLEEKEPTPPEPE